jgi:hypothetical protein
MGASIGSGPEIGPPMGAQLVAGATSPARASQVIAVDHRRPFEAHLGNTVRARVERSFGWLSHWGGLARDRAGRLDVAAARLTCACVLSGFEALLNPMPIRTQ